MASLGGAFCGRSGALDGAVQPPEHGVGRRHRGAQSGMPAPASLEVASISGYAAGASAIAAAVAGIQPASAAGLILSALVSTTW